MHQDTLLPRISIYFLEYNSCPNISITERLQETRASFGVLRLTSPSSNPNVDLAASAAARVKEEHSCSLRCAADLIVLANHERLLVCVSVPSLRGRDCI